MPATKRVLLGGLYIADSAWAGPSWFVCDVEKESLERKVFFSSSVVA